MEKSENGKSKQKRVVVEEIPADDSVSTEKISNTAKETVKPPDVITEPPVKEEPISQSRPERVKTNPSNLYLWVLIPGTILLVLLVGGIFVYQKGLNKTKTESSPIPEATITPQGTTTPATSPQAFPTKIDLKKYSITILNGSGKPGEAGKVQSLLLTAGFKVLGLGNAKTYDYTKTVIQVKESVDKTFLDQLKTTLGKSYSVDDKIQTLSASSQDEVIVTVGTTLSK